jgi:hypothetical protein
MGISTHKIKPSTSYDVPPTRLAGVEGTATEVRTGNTYADVDYTAGDAPFVFGAMESETGAILFLEF